MTVVNPMKQTILITGAARRIGRGIAETLARTGWNVVVHAHRATAEADALCAALTADTGARAWRVAGDLAAVGGPDAVFAAALAQAGRIDALVNNAAVFARQPLADATAADFDHQWRVNALAPMMLTQRLADHLKRRDAVGCAVNLLDQRITQPDAMAVPYLVSKKALEAYTLSAALAFAPRLRVNAVAPGAVLPPTDTAAREAAGEFPLSARPTVSQVAAAVRFLLEAESTTGQILFVDGGQHLL